MNKLFTFSLLILLLSPILFSCSPKIPSNKPFLNYVNNPKDTAAIKELLSYYSKNEEVENYLYLMWRTVLDKPFSELSVTMLDTYINILYYIKNNPKMKFHIIKANFSNLNTHIIGRGLHSETYYYVTIADWYLRDFLEKYDKDTLQELPLFEKNHQLLKNFFEDLDKNSLKLDNYKSNEEFEKLYFAKFYLELYKRDLTEPFAYYIFAAYSAENEEIRNWLNNNSEKVIALEDFLKNYQWQKIQQE